MTSQQNYTFHDEHGERTVIAVVRLSSHRYRASVIEGEGQGALGFGPSTYSAIADLNVNIEQSEET
jgi:hypothetical protein